MITRDRIFVRILILASIIFILPRGFSQSLIESAKQGNNEDGLFQLVLFTDNTNEMESLVPYYISSTNGASILFLQQVLEVAMDFDRPNMVSAILSGCTRLETNSLQKASTHGDDAAVRSILAANPNSVNETDLNCFMHWTPLHAAAISGQGTVVETLLENHANPNVQDDIGNTPLLWATYFGYTNVVDVLLDHKANMDIQGNTELNTLGASQDTPLDYAIQRGFSSIAAMLITNGANLGPHKYYADTPLHLATSKGNVELVKLLLEHGANVNPLSGASWTAKVSPLDIAVQGNSPEIVRLLISHGARFQTNTDRLFGLWLRSGNPAIADELVTVGCNANITNSNGQTLLHSAVDQNQIKAMEWLLEHTAEVNAKDVNGQTPLHIAVMHQNIKTIQCLLDYKANVNASDKNGKTPLALFEDLKIKEMESPIGIGWPDFKSIENLLLEHGAKGPILTSDPKKMPMVRF
jgi:ankyrin repeat protein